MKNNNKNHSNINRFQFKNMIEAYKMYKYNRDQSRYINKEEMSSLRFFAETVRIQPISQE